MDLVQECLLVGWLERRQLRQGGREGCWDSPELLDNLAIADRLARMMDGAPKIQGNSGTREDARTALRRWATRSTGGGSAGARRVARATRERSARRLPGRTGPKRDAPHIRALAGQPVEVAIGAIHPSLLSANVIDNVPANNCSGLRASLAGRSKR
jgi:hypothetical protein